MIRENYKGYYERSDDNGNIIYCADSIRNSMFSDLHGGVYPHRSINSDSDYYWYCENYSENHQ